jgi:peptidoglycan/xylan/chitin deacetylase (PgdA/CDA1 family)
VPPLPIPLPIPPLDLTLAPPALPRIPSLPQVLPPNAPGPSGSTQLPQTSATLDAKLLIISADGTEPVLTAMRQAADYEGIPYTLYIASRTPNGFTPSMLSNGGQHGFYQGILMTTGSLAYNNGTQWTSAFTAAEWQTLWDYQAKYRVRTAIGYVFPTADYGYGASTGIDTTTSPISATLTSSGRPVFSYVNTANPLTITRAWTYLAPASGTGTTVLLTDASNDALALVKAYPDGRQVLSMTFDGNFFLVHSLTLAHGLLNWVTGGLFLGERHVYATSQIDDIFIDDDLFGGGTYRINGTDWAAVVGWQTLKRQDAMTADLLLHMAFNGQGTTGTYVPDTLTPAARVTQSEFPWINHTYSHENLDNVSYDQAYREINRNNTIAASMGFTDYDRRALVTPDISGLQNPEAMRAAHDAGVRYVVSDTSRAGMDNPTPQTGIPNWEEPDILMIPRRPTNLYYNVTTPTEWTNEYNSIYRSYWGRNLTYSEILDKESDVLLQYQLRGEIDPWMFHESNLRAYDGVHTLLTDLLDRLLQKYRRLVVLPVSSPTQVSLGQSMQNRMNYNAAGVHASIAPEQGTITITASRSAIVPVTGLCAESAELYGGQCISHVTLGAGQSATFNVR